MAFMTGVGQLPCTDSPSPIPRLTSPDAHMSHSLSLSLWEQQHGCLRGPGREDAGERVGKTPVSSEQKDLCQEVQNALACPRSTTRAPSLAPHLLPGTRRPPHAHSCLGRPSAPGQESPPWLREGSGRGPHSFSTPPQLPISALGSSLMEQEVFDLRKFALCSVCRLGHCALIPRISFQAPDWSFLAQGAKPSKFPRGAQHAS